MSDPRVTAAVDQFTAAAHELAEAIRGLWRCSCGDWNNASRSRCKRCAKARGTE